MAVQFLRGWTESGLQGGGTSFLVVRKFPAGCNREAAKAALFFMKPCPKLTFGVGDRFGHGAHAQLAAFIGAKKLGIEITPVWNKSNREHDIIGSQPSETRAAADRAVADLGWKGDYFLDADHINLATVDRFTGPCDFFTLDVAEDIGRPADPGDIQNFLNRHPELIGRLDIAGMESPLEISREEVTRTAGKFLRATLKAGEIFRRIVALRGDDDFVTEVSMDETDAPQNPLELLVILAALADAGVPLQTIAPKFTGRFNKGVDYVGDGEEFGREFRDDIAVIAHAVEAYGLPASLKLSVHSGSDKFSIYPVIREAIRATGAGLHVKTAGTNWLEEVIGLAEAGSDALALAKEIYAGALNAKETLCAPYATVINIAEVNLPRVEVVAGWSSAEFVGALRHDLGNSAYNPDFRQLLHVGFKIAARMGSRYTDALLAYRETVSRNVTGNLLEKHIKPLFV